MDPRQVQYYNESIQYCNKLLSMLEREKDTIRNCFKGELLNAYLDATEETVSRTKKVREALQALQAIQDVQQ